MRTTHGAKYNFYILKYILKTLKSRGTSCDMRKWYRIQIPVSFSKAAGSQSCWTLYGRGRACKAGAVHRLRAPRPRCTPGSNPASAPRRCSLASTERRETSPAPAKVQGRVLAQRAGELGLPCFYTETPNPCSAAAFSSDSLLGLGRGHHQLRPRCARSGAAGGPPPHSVRAPREG